MCRSVTKSCLSHKVGMTDADYLEAWHQVVLPLAAEFQPDLVVVLFFLWMFIIIHSSSNADSGVGRI